MANYTVEKILDCKVAKGKKKYRIKWKGYPLSESTWEPAEHMTNCREMLRDF